MRGRCTAQFCHNMEVRYQEMTAHGRALGKSGLGCDRVRGDGTEKAKKGQVSSPDN